MTELEDAGRDRFDAATRDHIDAERDRLRDDIASRQRRLQELGEQLRLVSRELYRTHERLRALDGIAHDEQARLAGEYDAIRRLDNVAGIAIDGSVVRIATGPIVLVVDDRRYLVGRFELQIDLDRGIRINNLANTSTRAGWDHPHVQGGAPCLGNLQEACSILLGRYELASLVSLLLQFLDSYESVTAYAPVSTWREVPA